MNTQRMCSIYVSSIVFVLLIAISGCDKGKHEATEKGIPSTQHADHPPVDAHDETHEHDDGDDHDHDHNHAHVDDHGEQPMTYAAAVSQIEHELQEIVELLDTGKVEEAHEACDIIVRICEQLPKLAMDSESGVPREAIKSINQLQKSLADQANKAHAASEGEDADQLKILYAGMAKDFMELCSYVSHDDSGHDHHHE